MSRRSDCGDRRVTFWLTAEQSAQLDELAEVYGSSQKLFDKLLTDAYENFPIRPQPGKYYDAEKYRITSQADQARAAADAGQTNPPAPSSDDGD